MLPATSGLLTQQQAFQETDPWRRTATRDLAQRLEDSEFPCVFSRNAFKRGLVHIVFVEGSGPDDFTRLASALTDYTVLSRDWDGRLDSAYPLVVLFSDAATGHQDLDGFRSFGWHVLQSLHDLDPSPWPEEIAHHPSDPQWSMCFSGMPLFVNMSTPVHVRRRSRNLGDHFAMVINPRERFDVVAGDTPRGRKTRSNIRRRVDRYDEISRSSDLGTFGSGALEWQQYELLDDNTSEHSACPFVPR